VHSPGRIRIAERRVRQWSKFGASVELLSRDQTGKCWDRMLVGGFLEQDRRPYQSLALSRGLARWCWIAAAAS